MKRNRKNWLKILAVLIFTALFIFLIYTDKTKLQLLQPEGEAARAGEVLFLTEELVLAGGIPADKAAYEAVRERLVAIKEETTDNYIDYELYCRLWTAFLGEEKKGQDEMLSDLYDKILYKGKYKEEFYVLRQDWYQSYDEVLRFWGLQEVIRKQKIELLCTGDKVIGENPPKEGEILDVSGQKYIYISEDFEDLCFTAVWAYVREERLIVCREVLKESFSLNNLWIMEADKEGIRFFYKNYEFFVKWRSLPDKPEQYREQIADLTFAEGSLYDYNVKKDRIAGKLLRLGDKEVEIEGYGTYLFKENCRGYRLYDTLKEARAGELSIGYDFADFVIEDGKICSFLLLRKEEMESIRVLIRNNGFSDKYHEKLQVCCEEDMVLTYGSYDNRIEETVPAGEILTLTSDSSYLEEERIILEPVSGLGKIKITSLERSQGNPLYRGKLEVVSSEKGLIVINEVLLEEYLYSVVPSEMPASYPGEALKAQAICARTYAYNYLLSPGIGNLGAHVDDSTGYQVHNNITENVNSTKAVKETLGDILTCQNEPVSTYYYSTSCGYGGDEQVWSKDKSKSLTYLQPVHLSRIQDIEEAEVFTPEELCEEKNFREYITQAEESSFEKNEAWYRWHSTVNQLDTERLFQRLYERYQAVPDKVLTYTGDTNTVKLAEKKDTSEEAYDELLRTGRESEHFLQKSPKEFRKIFGMICIERLPGGVMDELLIITDKGTYKVISEYSIRYILKQDAEVIRQDGSVYEGGNLLPSAYFVLDEVKKENAVVGYEITGGGYGHGVGMSQNGAKAMAVQGYRAEEILTFFFRDCKIEKQY